MIDTLHTNPLSAAAARALVEFLWQGAALGIAAAAALTMLRRRSPGTRYLAACVALALMCLAPAATFLVELQESASALPQINIEAARPPAPADAIQERHAEASTIASDALAPAIQRWLDAHSAELLIVWLSGVTLFSARFGRDWFVISRIRRDARPIVHDRLAAGARAAAHRMGVSRAVLLLSSTRVVVPAVIGWLKPAILIPAGLLSGFPHAQLEAILAHELAHVRRADFLINTLQCAAEVLLFYHPAVWWISKRIRVEREQCADDLAIAAAGDRLTYLHALASLESARAESLALAMGAERDLLARIRRIVEPESVPRPRFPGGLVMTSTVLLFAFVLSGGPAATPIDIQAPPLPAPSVPVPSSQTGADGLEKLPPAASLVPARPAQSSSARATVTGTVRDKQGGVLPGVSIYLQWAGGGTPDAAPVITDPKGGFTLANLQPGQYTLTAVLTGFRTNRSRLEVQAGPSLHLAIVMEIGTLMEEVTVSSAAPEPGMAREARRSSPDEYLALARMYYAQGRLVEAEDVTKKALARVQAEIPTAPTGQQPDGNGPIRVGGSLSEPKKIKDVKPAYPAEAAAAGTQGVVVIEARVGTDGTVVDAQVVRGVPGLDDAAVGAVRQWRYTPTKLNGQAVEVLLTVTVSFVLR